MNCSRFRELIHDHLEPDAASAALAEEASPSALTGVAELDSHLATCPACRAELASLRSLRTATKNLPRELTPVRDLWPEIQKEISAAEKVAPVFDWRSAGHRPALLWKLAAAVAILAGTIAGWKWRTLDASPSWQIASLAGAPQVDSKSFQGESRLRVGQWLETDTTSRAKVAVGNIGEVNVEPNSRLRLVDASATDHRLELARGKLSARIWAPPRLFFVNTPSATAVDLGCAYTLDVDAAGAGLLFVTAGYVALAHDGRETVIPAGQMCATRRGAGPGTPFVADAPAALRRALDRFDFENAAVTALPEILAQARAEDGITLWHLLSRAPAAARGDVFDRLARDHAPPAKVTRDGIIAGDAAMLTSWGADLGQLNVFGTKKKIP